MNLLALLTEHQQVMAQLESLLPTVEKAAQQIVLALQQGGKVFFMGNGGSAADSQHLAAELIGRFQLDRPALPAIALNTDTSILTCLSNDMDYSIVFSRQLEALCQPNDVVVGLSTSGNSQNVLKGIEAANKIGAYTIGFSGRGGKLKSLVNLCLCVPSETVSRIQEAHIFMGHTLCEYVENVMSNRLKKNQSCEEIITN